jgi:hypothetical protein
MALTMVTVSLRVGRITPTAVARSNFSCHAVAGGRPSPRAGRGRGWRVPMRAGTQGQARVALLDRERARGHQLTGIRSSISRTASLGAQRAASAARRPRPRRCSDAADATPFRRATKERRPLPYSSRNPSKVQTPELFAMSA